jgi:Allene oxide cyclase barrel like domain
MLKKLSILVVGALVLVGGGITMAFASSNITQPETLVLNDETIKEGNVDVGKPGFGPGDSFMFVDKLTDPADGSVVGKAHGSCTFELQQWAYCQAGAVITDRGQIVVDGFIKGSDGPSTFDLAVTGGTGEFDNVRGSLEVAETSNNKSTLTFTLIP